VLLSRRALRDQRREPRRRGRAFDDELNANQSRIAKLLIKPAAKNPILEKFKSDKKESGEAAQKHKGDEGVDGQEGRPQAFRARRAQGRPNNKDQARC
jgi:hypothetical protein